MEHIPTGMWFEELVPGTVIEHEESRSFSQEENVEFCRRTSNPAWLHVDEEFAATTEFGRPLVNSLLTLSFAVGVSVADTTQGTTVANLGFGAVEFPAPVFPGDTLRVTTTVTAARVSRSRPGQGVVTFEHRAFNEDDQLVCRAERTALMKGRVSGEP